MADLKLTATLADRISGQISGIITNIEKAGKKSIAQNDKVISEAKKTNALALKIQKQAAIAEASLVLDKFERRIAIERVKHAQSLRGLQGNLAAQEAEVKRHNATIARLQMDQKNFPNTPFQQLLGTLGKLPGTLLGVTGAAGAGFLAFSKLTQGIRFAITAAEEQIASDRSLQAVLTSTGNAAGGTFQELQKLAAGYQMTTKFQDDAVQGAQGVLLQFDRIGKESFPRALQASVDLASVLGVDLKSAAKTVGLAMQDPEAGARMLRSANIALLPSEREKIKVWMEGGEAAKAQAFILGRLEKATKGHAEATTSSLTILKNSAGELLEGFGVTFVSGMEKAASAILRVTKAMADGSLPQMGALPAGLAPTSLPGTDPASAARKKALSAGLDAAKVAQAGEAAKTKGPSVDQMDHLDKIINEEREQKKKAAEDARNATQEEAKRMAEITIEAENANLNAKRMNDMRILDLERDKNLQKAQIRADEERTEEIYRQRQIDADRKMAAAKRDIAFQSASNILAAGQMLFSQTRKNAGLLKTLAIGEIGLGAARAVMAALAPPPSGLGPVAGMPLALSIGALGAAQALKASQQKFAIGGIVDGPSSGDMVPIRANGGEMVLNKQQQAQLFSMASGRGGGGFTHSGDVHINLPGFSGTSSQAQAVGTAVANGYIERVKEWKRMERDSHYLGIS